jgi:hypothetical protein
MSWPRLRLTPWTWVEGGVAAAVYDRRYGGATRPGASRGGSERRNNLGWLTPGVLALSLEEAAWHRS